MNFAKFLRTSLLIEPLQTTAFVFLKTRLAFAAFPFALLTLVFSHSHHNGKYSAHKEFQNLTVRVKKLLTTFRNSNRKIIYTFSTTNASLSRIRSYNQFNEFRWASIKWIPMKKTLSGVEEKQLMSGNSPAYWFLHLIQHIQATPRSTSPDKTTVVHVGLGVT